MRAVPLYAISKLRSVEHACALIVRDQIDRQAPGPIDSSRKYDCAADMSDTSDAA